MSRKEWPLYEVFIRSRNGLNHMHVGSVHAPDPKMALENARDIKSYLREELKKILPELVV